MNRLIYMSIHINIVITALNKQQNTYLPSCSSLSFSSFFLSLRMQHRTSIVRISAKVRSQYVLAQPTTTAARFDGKQHRQFLVCSFSLLLGKRVRVRVYARLNYSCCLQSKSKYAMPNIT